MSEYVPLGRGTDGVKSVHVTVGGKYGCLTSYLIDGTEVLQHEESSYRESTGTTHTTYNGECPGALAGSRMQLHRAETDNDKGGYTSLWDACGINTEMNYVHVTDNAITDVSDERLSNEKLGFIRKELSHDQEKGVVSVRCQWTTRPQKYTR